MSNYEKVWGEIKDHIEDYMHRIAHIFSTVYGIDEDNDCEWNCWLRVGELYLTISLVDSVYYEGEDMGFNVKVQINDSYGVDLFVYVPYNFTLQVWTFDVAELKQRLDFVPWHEVVAILALQRRRYWYESEKEFIEKAAKVLASKSRHAGSA